MQHRVLNKTDDTRHSQDKTSNVTTTPLRADEEWARARRLLATVLATRKIIDIGRKAYLCACRDPEKDVLI